ncbi:hypothetical protein [Roseovarius amoyensis]|uniref:hypothetical protein n=1 Tax=Roseovarius amoyensis TaxID=2211448 RepID=UPI000DBE0428|nr:hypothetical protein [Roseovarius amoyensis]
MGVVPFEMRRTWEAKGRKAGGGLYGTFLGTGLFNPGRQVFGGDLRIKTGMHRPRLRTWRLFSFSNTGKNGTGPAAIGNRPRRQ